MCFRMVDSSACQSTRGRLKSTWRSTGSRSGNAWCRASSGPLTVRLCCPGYRSKKIVQHSEFLFGDPAISQLLVCRYLVQVNSYSDGKTPIYGFAVTPLNFIAWLVAFP